jgi:proteasome lid subunit RPN8/RPN11
MHSFDLQTSAVIQARRPAPPIRMSRHAMCQVMTSIAACGPETGGILLGPIGSTDICEFHFDRTAVCSLATYSPDHLTLSRLMKQIWMPSGLDLKGFCHSHPSDSARLSAGDLIYIRRLLQINPDMDRFAAPIVIPKSFRMEAIVVLAEQPDIQRPTYFELF